MLDLAGRIVESKAGHFDPGEFDDQYESALQALIKQKQSGQPIERPQEPKQSNVINLMDALRQSVKTESGRERKKSPAMTSAPKRAPAADMAETSSKAWSAVELGDLAARSPDRSFYRGH
jgi:DNA end-binding protein Ku